MKTLADLEKLAELANVIVVRNHLSDLLNGTRNVIKKGVTVTKVLVWNKVENRCGDEVSECELTFSDGSKLRYECDDVNELYNENVGIYELLDGGTYNQIEDWE